MLDENYWNSRYHHHETGWDLGAISTPLKEYIDQLEDKNISILIPGAGNAHEAVYLLENGFTNITVVDIAPKAIENLKSKIEKIDSKNYHLIRGDFFKHEGAYDLILEQTFFCALSPDLRKDYVKHMQQLLKPDGKLVGLLFNVKFPFDGPPFGGEKSEYERLFENHFKIEVMDEAYNSVKPRKGSELFVIMRKK